LLEKVGANKGDKGWLKNEKYSTNEKMCKQLSEGFTIVDFKFGIFIKFIQIVLQMIHSVAYGCFYDNKKIHTIIF
jgi:hypothetical protein